MVAVESPSRRASLVEDSLDTLCGENYSYFVGHNSPFNCDINTVILLQNNCNSLYKVYLKLFFSMSNHACMKACIYLVWI